MERLLDVKNLYRQEWIHAGVACKMVGGSTAINGYVQLGPALRERWATLDIDEIPLEAHGGLTYGIDSKGWVGFDTSHCTDWWAVDDVIGRVLVADMKALATVHGCMRMFPGARRWTLERLHDEVERLADQVVLAALG